MELSHLRDEPSLPRIGGFEWAFVGSHSQLAIVFPPNRRLKEEQEQQLETAGSSLIRRIGGYFSEC